MQNGVLFPAPTSKLFEIRDHALSELVVVGGAASLFVLVTLPALLIVSLIYSSLSR